MSRIFLTSDTHFYHTNIITYSKRPFLNTAGEPDTALMNKTLVERWNSVVTSPSDVVYFLGDFALGYKPAGFTVDDVKNIREQLNGKIYIYPGNHDPGKRLLAHWNLEILPRHFSLELEGIKFLLGHYPAPTEDVAHYHGCDFKVCGHVHEAWPRKGHCINVGVDVRNFTPVSAEELVQIARTPLPP